jgi:hypothetical protein
VSVFTVTDPDAPTPVWNMLAGQLAADIKKLALISAAPSSTALAPPLAPAEPPAPPAARHTPATVSRSASPSGNVGGTPLRNADIITMAQAGLSDDIILLKIAGAPTAFDTSVDALVALKKAGVSDRVLAAMLSAGKTAAGQ